MENRRFVENQNLIQFEEIRYVGENQEPIITRTNGILTSGTHTLLEFLQKSLKAHLNQLHEQFMNGSLNLGDKDNDTANNTITITESADVQVTSDLDLALATTSKEDATD